MTINYQDAFIPVINIGKKSNNYFLSSQSLSPIYKFKKNNCLNLSKRLGQNPLIMKSMPSSKIDALEIMRTEINPNQKNLKNSIQTLPNSYRRMISLLIFASFILSGWYLTPSKNRYISFTASLVSSGLAFLITKKINSKNSVGASFKILELISNGIQNSDFKKIVPEIKTEFNLSSEDLDIEIMNIYKKYVLIFLRDPSVRLDEIQELIKIKNLLGITSQGIGEIHIEIARDLYKEYTIDLERKSLEYSSDKINKFLFLSDRIFSFDSVKGYQYELSRLRKVFLFSNEKIANICSSISYSSYAEIIKSAAENNFYDFKNLDYIQKMIGINNQQKQKIHSEFIRNSFNKVISNQNKITDLEYANIETIKNLFKMEDTEFQEILLDIIKPAFFSEVVKAVNECTQLLDDQTIKKITRSLIDKKNDLLIPLNEIKNQISIAVKNLVGDTINSTINDSRMQKTTECLKGMEKIICIQISLSNILRNFDLLTEKEIADLFNNGSFYGIGKNYKSEEINKIFSKYVENCINEFSIESKDEEKIVILRQVFSISDSEYESIYNSVTEPIFSSEITRMIESDKFDQLCKNELKNIQNSLKMKSVSILSIKTNIYKRYLQNFIETSNILTTENASKLNRIKAFLSLRWTDIQEIHDNLNEPFYRKAISEAMGASGFISTNYWNSLEKLRIKLQITEKKARFSFYQVSKDKMRQLFDQAVIEYKRKLQLKNEGKDSKEDSSTANNNGTALGIEAGNMSGNELSNLIDFYTRNKIYLEKEIPIEICSNVNLKGLSGRSESRQCINVKPEYVYPINLTGLFDKKIVSEMYKQYLVECFSSKIQTEKRRLFNNLDKLGPILGIDSTEINSTHTNVGSLVYKQFLGQALNKGYIDKSETAFLASIQNTLSMDNFKCSELIKDAKKNRIAIFVESIFATPKINSEKVSEMRKMALFLGVDLQNDLSISIDQCAKLFRVEIDSNIEKGLITSENQSLVEEIRLSFGLSKEVVKKVLLETITTRCEGHLINAVASLRKNSTSESMMELRKMINFGNLLPIRIQSTVASKKEREQLFSLFQSTENNQAKLSLLKIMLNL